MHYLLLLISITIFTACGGGNSSTNQNEELLLSTFPKKLTVTLPLKLEPNRMMLTRYSDKSHTYEMMQTNIISNRDHSNEIKDELNMVEKLLNPILNACEGTDLDDSCHLEANLFSFNLSKKELRTIKRRYGALNIDFDVNKTLYLGEVTFVEHKTSNPYDYSLIIDMTQVYLDILGEAYKNANEESLEKRLLTLSWSIDNKAVYSALRVDSNSSRYIKEFDYLLDENSSETVYVYDYSFFTGVDDWSGEEYKRTYQKTMLFRKNFDENNSYDYRMQDDYEFKEGKISDATGSHITSSLDSNSQIIVFFDNNGTELGEYGCLTWDSLDSCSIEDKSTWGTESESEQNASALDKTAKLYIRNIEASDTTLKEGKYFLLAPNVKIETMAKEEILEQSIGEFMVTGTEIKGVLYDAQYEDKLSELKIVQGLSSKVITVEVF